MRVWEEISIGSVWKTFLFSQQGLMMISLHQDHHCDTQNIHCPTNKKETKKERGKEKPLNQKTEKETSKLVWFPESLHTRKSWDCKRQKERKGLKSLLESKWVLLINQNKEGKNCHSSQDFFHEKSPTLKKPQCVIFLLTLLLLVSVVFFAVREGASERARRFQDEMKLRQFWRRRQFRQFHPRIHPTCVSGFQHQRKPRPFEKGWRGR